MLLLLLVYYYYIYELIVVLNFHVTVFCRWLAPTKYAYYQQTMVFLIDDQTTSNTYLSAE